MSNALTGAPPKALDAPPKAKEQWEGTMLVAFGEKTDAGPVPTGPTATTPPVPKPPDEKLTQRCAALLARLALPPCADPPGAATDEKAALGLERTRITKLLDPPPIAEGLDAAEKAIVDFEKTVAATLAAVGARGKKRTDLLAEMVAIPDPPGIAAAQLTSIKLARKPIRDVPATPTDAELLVGTEALKALRITLATIGDECAAAAKAAVAVGLAEAALRDAATRTTANGKTFLAPKCTALQADLGKATTIVAWDKVAADAALFCAAAQEAALFGDEHAELKALQPVLGARPLPATNVAAIGTALSTADTSALAGAFAAARKTLATAKAAPDIKNVDKVYVAIAAFRASPGGKRLKELDRIKAELPGFATLPTAFEAAKKKGLPPTPPPAATVAVPPLQTATAISEITALTARANGYAAYADQLPPVKRLKASPEFAALPKPARDKVAALELAAATLCTGGNPAAGAAKLGEILALPELASLAPCLAAKAKADNLMAGIGTVATMPGTTFALGEGAKAAVLAGANKLSEATVAYTALAPALLAIQTFREAGAGFDRAVAGMDPALVTKLRADADADATANRWADAADKLAKADKAAVAWRAYLDRKAEADLAAAAAPTPQKGAIDAVLARAKQQADADKPAEALAILAELRQMDDVAGLDADAAAAREQLAAAKPAVAAAVKLLAAAPAGKVLTDLLAKITVAVDTTHDLKTALVDLATLRTSVKDATAYARSRDGATAALTALLAVTTTPPLFAAPKDKTDAQDAVKATAGQAAGGDFAGAAAKLDTLRTGWKALCKRAADKLETDDHGHSIAAHGPATAPTGGPDLQLARIQTGRRADGQNGSECPIATSFHGEDDWLAARQMAAAALKADYGVDITAGAKGPGNLTKVEVIIEHGRPIDRAVAGQQGKLKVKQGGPAVGEAQASGTFDTYEIWTGLTRTRSNFVLDNGATKWRLHQQFPHPDDWDNDAQRYTAPVPQISFS